MVVITGLHVIICILNSLSWLIPNVHQMHGLSLQHLANPEEHFYKLSQNISKKQLSFSIGQTITTFALE